MEWYTKAARAVAWAALLVTLACQSYPFEERPSRRSQVHKISEVVMTVRPTDILFVVDNSGTMEQERHLIRDNVEAFLNGLLESAVDFQVGLITTDVECNLPTHSCGPGGTSSACCALRGGVWCSDVDTDSDGEPDKTDCDGGRLRSATGLNRVFRPPAPAEREAWIADFSGAITALDCSLTQPQGSSFEAGLEAAARAVTCGAAEPTLDDDAIKALGCADPNVARLNAGFIRPDADLVLIFITDEDDCSFPTPDSYMRPPDPKNINDQQWHLCSPDECYAHYWADSGTGGLPFQCDTWARQADPPQPAPVADYLEALIAAKRDLRRVRAAAIIGGAVDATGPLGFRAGGCVLGGVGGSTDCNCSAGAGADVTTPKGAMYCDLTDLLGQRSSPRPYPPPGTADEMVCQSPQSQLGGCTAMPGSRYAAFLRELADRRLAVGASADVLVDSICQARYDDTLYRIVNNLIIKNCFDLGRTIPAGKEDLVVRLNGVEVPNVEVHSTLPGWSWRPGSSEICLEGGMKKTVKDEFEIFVLSQES